ncbi:hypothetical protein, partial [Rhodoplanes sp. SY1]|uniref:hypothetical protein n=1 Tax=Rhodoplanes sp. SY1 TaxID=3166646 RepID=UPI0038B54A84
MSRSEKAATRVARNRGSLSRVFSVRECERLCIVAGAVRHYCRDFGVAPGDADDDFYRGAIAVAAWLGRETELRYEIEHGHDSDASDHELS